jgi:hypothetical protein
MSDEGPFNEGSRRATGGHRIALKKQLDHHQKSVRYYGIYAQSRRRLENCTPQETAVWGSAIEHCFQTKPEICRIAKADDALSDLCRRFHPTDVRNQENALSEKWILSSDSRPKVKGTRIPKSLFLRSVPNKKTLAVGLLYSLDFAQQRRDENLRGT